MASREVPGGSAGFARAFLHGGGELGERIAAFDWRATPLGPPETWPRSLQFSVRVMLTSRQPIWIGWGEPLIYLYNDAYKAIIGGKHPWALGRPTSEVWREIWPDIGPMLATAMQGVSGTYVESQLLVMERNGYPEETYYTFSYSPIPDDDGSVGGIFCANSDDTRRVIGERQLALLRELAAASASARDWREACAASAAALAANRHDLPFALIYMTEPDGDGLMLAGASGIDAGHVAAPLRLGEDGHWPVARAMARQEPALLDDRAAMDWLPSGPWPRPPSQAAVLPILPGGETGRAGALVVGLNPYRLYDADYAGFLGLVAGQIAAAVAHAQAYAEERRRAEALAEIDRAKTSFFANVSHEFRTPLTLMLGPIEDALDDRTHEALPERQRARIELAQRNSLRLLKLVNALLDFSRIEAGRFEASFAPVDLAGLTASLAANFRAATERAGLTLTIDCPALPQPVLVDAGMWEKVVLNLLSNAFKFTFAGGIAVRLRASPDGRTAELRVEDSGVGIPEHELPRLFERFHRIEGQRSRSFEGSGIGLALVQELVQQHGGTIDATSKVGRGTVFSVLLPFGDAHLPPERIGASRDGSTMPVRAEAYVDEVLSWLSGSDAMLPERADEAPLIEGPRSRILVVDDNLDMRSYLTRLLAPRWDVEAVGDGAAALAAITRQVPDLVLTDVMMPGVDGFGLLAAVRADPALRHLPVIMLSARAGEEARVEGLDAGADDYLTKPFTARELVARINTNLALARIRRDAMGGLQESEARFRNMADHAPVILWVTNASGYCSYLNRQWYEFTGQAHDEGLEYGWLDSVHADDRAAVAASFAAARAAWAPVHLEYRLRRADGAWRWMTDAAAPRFDGDGTFVGYIGSVVDITERREAEAILQHDNEALARRVDEAVREREAAQAQLFQAQKMEAVGRLTGGVAHDFNNVLQVIAGNLQLLLKDVEATPAAERRLQTALAGVSRGSRLAAQLLAFGRRQPLAPRVVSLGRLLRDLDEMLHRTLGDGIEIGTAVAEDLWNAFVDDTQVENALLNLAINARDAMPGGGRLSIEAANARLGGGSGDGEDEVRPGEYVMLAVTDTGTGIPAEILPRVYEPFFTTKSEGEGTGLGLSMVYGFVKQSGGHIRIASEPGRGTTVRIFLPRSLGAEDAVAEQARGPAAGGTETVLVVEDDPDVRATVVETLADLGYRVLRAKDAQDALAVIDSGVPIDLLFSDVVMPGPIRSSELVGLARARLPGLAVLFTSGYSDEAARRGGRRDGNVDLLSKPYAREVLAHKLREALERRPAAPATRGDGKANGMGTRRILLVEDNVLIRMSTAAMLEDLGHAVREAGDADEALALLEAEPADVLMTDIGLPGMSGTELAAEALRRWPGLQVVFVSGQQPVVGPGHADGVRVLHKPYDREGLRRVLAPATS